MSRFTAFNRPRSLRNSADHIETGYGKSEQNCKKDQRTLLQTPSGGHFESLQKKIGERVQHDGGNGEVNYFQCITSRTRQAQWFA